MEAMGYERGEELGHGSFGYALKVRRRQDGRTYGATKCRALTASRAQCLTRCGRIQWLHRQRTSPDKVENARQQWIALSLQEGNLEWARALGWDGDPSFGASPDAAVAPAAACPAAAAPNSMAPLGALGSKLGGRLSFRRAGAAQRADETAPPCARLPAQRSASLPPVPPSALDTFILNYSTYKPNNHRAKCTGYSSL